MNNKKNPLTFKVSALMEKGTGAKILYSFDAPAKFENIKTKSNANGKVEVMRLEHGVNVKVCKYNQEVELECSRCLKKFTYTSHFSDVEKIFLINPPARPDDPNDIFLVDKKNQEIDITELIRQEIILHFPMIPVCYTSCKGICFLCGADKNKKDCNCKPEEAEENKPFKALKDILKKQNYAKASSSKTKDSKVKK